jgi:hypothetical protein
MGKFAEGAKYVMCVMDCEACSNPHSPQRCTGQLRAGSRVQKCRRHFARDIPRFVPAAALFYGKIRPSIL